MAETKEPSTSLLCLILLYTCAEGDMEELVASNSDMYDSRGHHIGYIIKANMTKYYAYRQDLLIYINVVSAINLHMLQIVHGMNS